MKSDAKGAKREVQHGRRNGWAWTMAPSLSTSTQRKSLMLVHRSNQAPDGSLLGLPSLRELKLELASSSSKGPSTLATPSTAADEAPDQVEGEREQERTNAFL